MKFKPLYLLLVLFALAAVYMVFPKKYYWPQKCLGYSVENPALSDDFVLEVEGPSSSCYGAVY